MPAEGYKKDGTPLSDKKSWHPKSPPIVKPFVDEVLNQSKVYMNKDAPDRWRCYVRPKPCTVDAVRKAHEEFGGKQSEQIYIDRECYAGTPELEIGRNLYAPDPIIKEEHAGDQGLISEDIQKAAKREHEIQTATFTCENRASPWAASRAAQTDTSGDL